MEKANARAQVEDFFGSPKKPGKLCVVHKLIRVHGKIIGLVASRAIDTGGKVA
jgi:hypothetical protein